MDYKTINHDNLIARQVREDEKQLTNRLLRMTNPQKRIEAFRAAYPNRVQITNEIIDSPVY